VIRGTSVFEGVLLAWSKVRERHYIVAVRQHFRRLARSASLIDVEPSPGFADEFLRAAAGASSRFTGIDVYARPTVFVSSGRTSKAQGSRAGTFIGFFPHSHDGSTGGPLRAMVSSYRRTPDAVPPVAKAGGSYLDFRLLQRERHDRDRDVSLLIDPAGNLLEADGAGILLVDDGIVYAPPTGGEALDSITRKLVLDLCDQNNFRIRREQVHRSRAHGSVLLITGTLSGVRSALLDESRMTPDKEDFTIADMLANLYQEAIHGENDQLSHFLTAID
jgi:branched-chain amino acid aminotransferase